MRPFERTRDGVKASYYHKSEIDLIRLGFWLIGLFTGFFMGMLIDVLIIQKL
jgi:hypothetical protein